jgi:hypothetical protein
MYKLFVVAILFAIDASLAIKIIELNFDVCIGDDAFIVVNKPKETCGKCVADGTDLPIQYNIANTTRTEMYYGQNSTTVILSMHNAFYDASNSYSFVHESAIITLNVYIYAMDCVKDTLVTDVGEYIIGLRYACNVSSRARDVTWVEDGNPYGLLGLNSYNLNFTNHTDFRNGHNNSMTLYILQIYPAVYKHNISMGIDLQYVYDNAAIRGKLKYTYDVNITPIYADLCDRLQIICNASDDVIFKKSFNEKLWSVLTLDNKLSIDCITRVNNAYYKCGRDDFSKVYVLNATKLTRNRKNVTIDLRIVSTNVENLPISIVEYSDLSMIIGGSICGMLFIVIIVFVITIVHIKIRNRRLNYTSVRYSRNRHDS